MLTIIRIRYETHARGVTSPLAEGVSCLGPCSLAGHLLVATWKTVGAAAARGERCCFLFFNVRPPPPLSAKSQETIMVASVGVIPQGGDATGISTHSAGTVK